MTFSTTESQEAWFTAYESVAVHPAFSAPSVTRETKYYAYENVGSTTPTPYVSYVGRGLAGANVTISGAGFGATQGTYSGNVYLRPGLDGIHDTALTIVSWSSTSIVVQIPTAALSPGYMLVVETNA